MNTTHWHVTSSSGFDALLLIGAAAGDVMQQELHPDEIQWLTGLLSVDGRAALDLLDRTLRGSGLLTGPTLVLMFSAGPTDSLDDVIASAADPGGRLLPVLDRSPYRSGEGLPAPDQLAALFPAVLTVLRELQAAGFEEWWADRFRPAIEAAVARNRDALTPYDVIPEQARLLGRELEPRIDVVITQFAKPYGIRVLGQRFIAHHEYEPAIQLRTAAHEIFHPPFDRADAELWRRFEVLGADPWMVSIVDNHDPKYGYNSFHGIVDEDSTQALDQLVSERIGVARDPATRWADADGGMHLLAAALYDAMKEDGFAERGGVYSSWLAGALDRGLLTPDEVRRRAAAVVGDDAVARWYAV